MNEVFHPPQITLTCISLFSLVDLFISDFVQYTITVLDLYEIHTVLS